MLDFDKIKQTSIVVYGLSTETERFIADHGDGLNIVGLLDGFRESGEMYGFPIISFDEAVGAGVKTIVVVARPGSCKAIAKRIGDRCRELDISVFDVRGKDLLQKNEVIYDFAKVKAGTYDELREMIDKADVVSFDLFDTLVARKVFEYTDVFELVDNRLKEKGVCIPDFAKLRLKAEKDLSAKSAPKLVTIYKQLLYDCDMQLSGGVSAGSKNIVTGNITPEEMAELEWKTDSSLMIRRSGIAEIFDYATAHKKVFITTDCYYTRQQLSEMLNSLGVRGYEDILVSSEYGIAKNHGLFDVLKQRACEVTKSGSGIHILHVGDDEYADIEMAAKYGIDSFKVMSGREFFYAMGGLGIEDEMNTLADHIKVGMLISEVFNSPFSFEEGSGRLAVADSFQIGYMFCAPMITDFVLWLKEKAGQQGIKQMLFCARDGYLPIKLYRKVDAGSNSIYFMCSRTAAIRAGMENEADIEYVDSMKYFGSPEEALRTRFGIAVKDVREIDRAKEILNKSVRQRELYRKYIETFNLNEGDIGVFDFVAKGTTQMYLQKLFSQKLKGFYFLQLEPEFMADKGMEIEPFYSDEEKNTSAIFDNYYILETILTSPDPQMLEFDADGKPVFAVETRSESDLAVFDKAQAGILSYFDEYLALVPEAARTVNKGLDEKLLELVNKILINDEDFLSLKVEDPFFGRMTNMKDLL